MKFRFACIAALALAASGAASAQANVNVTIDGRIAPGVYGRIDLGNAPPPPVVYTQPVLIAPPPQVVVQQQPVYLNVPPWQARDWGRYCGRYQACGVPVYFVRTREYAGREWRGEHEYHDRGRHRGEERGRGHDHHDEGDHGD